MITPGEKYVVSSKNSTGQALVLVLLSLAVVLTLVLFVLARSTTDISVSSRSEEAVRAFSAAEAGIESALVIGQGGSGTFENSTYTSSVTGFAELESEFNYPIKLSSGDTMIVWFADHTDEGDIGGKHFTGNSLKICWGDGSPTEQKIPAIEISIFYEATPENKGTTRIARAAFDPYVASRNPANKFAGSGGAGCTIGGVAYPYQQTIDLTNAAFVNKNGLLFARVRMFYNDLSQPVGISVSPDTLPSQGQDVSSTGQAGEANRKVQVFQGWPEPPTVFDYAIYSSTGLTKEN